MRGGRGRSLLRALLAMAAWGAGPAAAGPAEPPRVSIPLRDDDPGRRALEARGVAVGGMLLHATLENRLTQDSNVAASMHPVADTVLTVAPAVALHHGPNPWRLRLDAGAEAVRHHAARRLDHTNLRLAGRLSGGSLEGSRAYAGVQWQRLHELPGDTGLRRSAKVPVPVTRQDLDGAIRLQRGVVFLSGAVRLGQVTYRDVTASDGGTLDQTHRDHIEIALEQRVGGRLFPMLDLFVETRQRGRVYGRGTPIIGFNRSSEAKDLLLGAAIDLPERLAVHAVWGRTRQNHAMSVPLSVQVHDVAATLALTTLTTLTGQWWRTVGGTEALLQGAAMETAWRLGLEHELLRQVVLVADGGRSRWRQHGLIEGATDVDTVVRLAAEYRRDARWSAGLEARWDARASTAAGGGYTRSRMTLRIGARL